MNFNELQLFCFLFPPMIIDKFQFASEDRIQAILFSKLKIFSHTTH